VSANSTLTELQVAHATDRLPFNPFMRFLTVAAALGFLFDSFDTTLVAYLMPSIAREWKVAPLMLGLIASSAMWGTVAGQYLWGPLADKFGRRFAFQGTILSFGLLTGIAAFAWNAGSLMFARFIAGTGLGGFIPLDSVLTMEMVPTRLRGRLVSLTTVLFPGGQLLAVAVTMVLLSHIGWRGMFIVGALPAILAWVARRGIPETPRWLVTQGRYSEARKSLNVMGANDEMIAEAVKEAPNAPPVKAQQGRVSELFTKYRSRVVLTWGLWVVNNFGYFGFILWIPSILMSHFHFNLARSLSYTVIISCCAQAGRIVGVLLIDKIGRKPLISSCYIGAGVVAFIFGQQTKPGMILLFACLFMFLVDQASAAVVTYVPELYPTHIRALGASWAAGFGRIFGALAPIVLGALLAASSYYIIWIIYLAFYLAGAVLVITLGVETKGRPLEEVTDSSKESVGELVAETR
jgi:putative MFS transporter